MNLSSRRLWSCQHCLGSVVCPTAEWIIPLPTKPNLTKADIIGIYGAGFTTTIPVLERVYCFHFIHLNLRNAFIHNTRVYMLRCLCYFAQDLIRTVTASLKVPPIFYFGLVQYYEWNSSDIASLHVHAWNVPKDIENFSKTLQLGTSKTRSGYNNILSRHCTINAVQNYSNV